jgi:hypothetical protein
MIPTTYFSPSSNLVYFAVITLTPTQPQIQQRELDVFQLHSYLRMNLYDNDNDDNDNDKHRQL